MSSKPKLLSAEPMSLHSEWCSSLVNEYFTLETWDPTKTYDAHDLLLQYPGQHTDTDLRCVIDNLWEAPIGSTNYVLQNSNWFWYNESLWYTYRGHNQYRPNKTYNKLALMPMRKSKPHRDLLKKMLQPILNDLIWSYVDIGVELPNDIPGQRYFNPDWYDQTYFSIVSETTVEGPVFITEKTFKPIAFRHPFIVYGPQHLLAQLHNLGFVTFEHLFDESYDSIPFYQYRIRDIVRAINNFVREPYSAETVERLDHNHNHFFNSELVKHCIRTEILEPLLHYAETR